MNEETTIMEAPVMEAPAAQDSGVEQSVAAEQNLEPNAEPSTQTGVKEPAAAEPKVDEKAFAARLKAERSKIEQEAEAARQKAVDAEYERIFGDQGIKSKSEYDRKLAEAQKQAEIDRLLQQNIPKDLAEKILKVDELEAWKKSVSEQEAKSKSEQAMNTRRQNMFNEFLREFPEYGSDEKWKTIPSEVFSEAKKWLDTNGMEGRKLSDAFALRHYKSELESFKQGKQTQESNLKNAAASPGSVTGNGTSPAALTDESIVAMSDKQRMSRWSEIKDFYKMK